MSFASLLRHVVHLERDVETGAEDEYAQPTTAPSIGGNFRASIQPKNDRKIREAALISQAGVSVGLWTIYCEPRIISSADKIIHDSSTCPMPEEIDLPDSTYEVTGQPRNAAGHGHHLEIDANLVGSSTPAVAGS